MNGKSQLTQLPPLDIRIPTWSMDKLETRLCPFCGSRGVAQFARPDRLIVNHCPLCGSYYIAPSPNQGMLDDFYKHYITENSSNKSLSDFDAKMILGMNPLSDVRISEIASMIDITGKDILDIGFGRGHFLVALKKLGANVTGLELDDDAIQFAIKRLGVESVYQVGFENYDTDNHYDVILMNDLIEHPLNPMHFLIKSNKLLKKDGLLIVWTPNASHISDDVECIPFRVDLEHMQYLTYETCEWIQKQTGLKLIHMEALNFPSLKCITRRESYKRLAPIKNVIKKIPGVDLMYSRHINNKNSDNIRLGKYSLFCIYQKM
jgi:2-polyprenyl-3-methyl-5-hydroxy-6-metoxy-1,4-benzoquinol methylase